LQAWGPVSCRHNDNWTLAKSLGTEQLESVQVNSDFKCVLYGDSAYFPEEYLKSRHRCGTGDNLSAREKLENDSMSKCRQSIEWDYGQVGNLWKVCTFKERLKLRKQPVCDLVSTCFLLTNAFNCLNGNQTALYFMCNPPTLEDWTIAGPREANIVEYFGWNEVVEDVLNP